MCIVAGEQGRTWGGSAKCAIHTYLPAPEAAERRLGVISTFFLPPSIGCNGFFFAKVPFLRHGVAGDTYVRVHCGELPGKRFGGAGNGASLAPIYLPQKLRKWRTNIQECWTLKLSAVCFSAERNKKNSNNEMVLRCPLDRCVGAAWMYVSSSATGLTFFICVNSTCGQAEMRRGPPFDTGVA